MCEEESCLESSYDTSGGVGGATTSKTFGAIFGRLWVTEQRVYNVLYVLQDDLRDRDFKILVDMPADLIPATSRYWYSIRVLRTGKHCFPNGIVLYEGSTRLEHSVVEMLCDDSLVGKGISAAAIGASDAWINARVDP